MDQLVRPPRPRVTRKRQDDYYEPPVRLLEPITLVPTFGNIAGQRVFVRSRIKDIPVGLVGVVTDMGGSFVRVDFGNRREVQTLPRWALAMA